MRLILCLWSLLATSCFIAPVARTVPARTTTVLAAADPIPPAKSGITLTVDRSAAPALERVMSEYERATGLHLITSSEVAAQLAKTSCGLSQTLEIPAERVHSTVERLLVQHGFVLTLLQAEQPILLGIERAENPNVRTRAYAVPASGIDAMADHPAILVSTVVTLPSTNVRDLANSARQLMVDHNLQQMVPMGKGSSLMLVGRGAEVATLVRTLTELDEIERRAQAENEKRDAERRAPKRDEAPPK